MHQLRKHAKAVAVVGGCVLCFKLGEMRGKAGQAVQPRTESIQIGVQPRATPAGGASAAAAQPQVVASPPAVVPSTLSELSTKLEQRLAQLVTHPAVRWGIPSMTPDVVIREGIVVGYDRRMRYVASRPGCRCVGARHL